MRARRDPRGRRRRRRRQRARPLPRRRRNRIDLDRDGTGDARQEEAARTTIDAFDGYAGDAAPNAVWSAWTGGARVTLALASGKGEARTAAMDLLPGGANPTMGSTWASVSRGFAPRAANAHDGVVLRVECRPATATSSCARPDRRHRLPSTILEFWTRGPRKSARRTLTTSAHIGNQPPAMRRAIASPDLKKAIAQCHRGLERVQSAIDRTHVEGTSLAALGKGWHRYYFSDFAALDALLRRHADGNDFDYRPYLPVSITHHNLHRLFEVLRIEIGDKQLGATRSPERVLDLVEVLDRLQALVASVANRATEEEP